MKLYLLRHGEAGEHAIDSRRALTAHGRQTSTDLGRALRARGISFDAIVSSNLVRARETAELVAEELKLTKLLTRSEHLTPNGDRVALLKELAALDPAPASLLLVGHEPFLSDLVSFLCTGTSELMVNMKKGMLVRLDVGRLKPGRCAVLEWMVTSGWSSGG